MIEDKELAEKIVKKANKLRELNQAVGDRAVRHAIDELLTAVYVLASTGSLKTMNGGKGFSGDCVKRFNPDAQDPA